MHILRGKKARTIGIAFQLAANNRILFSTTYSSIESTSMKWWWIFLSTFLFAVRLSDFNQYLFANCSYDSFIVASEIIQSVFFGSFSSNEMKSINWSVESIPKYCECISTEWLEPFVYWRTMFFETTYWEFHWRYVEQHSPRRIIQQYFDATNGNW